MAEDDQKNADVVNPHETDEDPEEHMGAVTPDPWDDKSQLDWPNNDDEQVEELVDDRDNVEVID